MFGMIKPDEAYFLILICFFMDRWLHKRYESKTVYASPIVVQATSKVFFSSLTVNKYL